MNMRPLFLLTLLLNWSVAFEQQKLLVLGELKIKSAGKQKSFGTRVTANRIHMINQLYNIQTQVRIVGLVDSFGEACGTQVILEIPV